MNFRKALENKKFVVTAELCPPKGVEIKTLIEKAAPLKNLVDGINVTDNQRAVVRLSSMAFSKLLLDQGFDPIWQLTCRDRNLLAIQSDILGAWALGIKNVLALSGDYPSKGDHPSARPVYDLDSVQLIDLFNKMNFGKDFAGTDLVGHPDFLIGAVANPGATPMEPQILKLRNKIDFGAKFIQTQVIYDIDIFKKFIQKLGDFPAKILAGIFPLVSYKNAVFLNTKVPGVSIPEKILKRMEKAKDSRKEGIAISIEIIRELKPLCAGIHLMTLNNIDIIPEILNEI